MRIIFFLFTSLIILEIQAQVTLKDRFNRDLVNQSIILVDWEGYIANPAIQLELSPPNGVSFPFTVTLTANHSRLYFDNPSLVGSNGPTKNIIFDNALPQLFYISIFPDRAGGDELYTLNISSSEGNQNFPIVVVDEDEATPSIDFNLLVNYEHDVTHNFFSNQAYKNIVNQAAMDWAFFLEDMNFDEVPIGNEQTFIWNDNLNGGNWVSNSTAYSGFLLYPHGVHFDNHVSGGQPSLHDFQKINGIATQLRRSGVYNAEIHGNFNTLGWDITIDDNTWFKGSNFGNEANDLYSIALHEMGHALSFNPGYPEFENYKNQGFINTNEVVTYQKATVPVDNFDHISGSKLQVDRISKQGCFGSEYADFFPHGRWLITKLNLLVLKAIGYDLRNTSAFVPVNILTENLATGTINQDFSTMLNAEGGVPFYNWTIAVGNLPNGLSINAFTGEISGTPTESGSFNITVSITDYDNETSNKSYNLVIKGGDIDLCTDAIIDIPTVSQDTYHAIETINSTASFTTNLVTFKAGNEINLLPGFHAQENSSFIALIENCSILTNDEKKQQSYNLVEVKEISSKIAKLKVFPNPFTGRTNIEFELVKPESISLIVFDQMGKLIETLIINNYYEAGSHLISFDAKNLPNGIYWTQLMSEDSVINAKIVLFNN